jgi:A/G-specific adenine glycosylase
MNSKNLDPNQFAAILLSWQSNHGRHDLPWHIDPTPYRVLVSEVMLQQTQVKTVIPYFLKWMETYPTIQDLANSSDEQVMSLWQGLGYYSRARNLRKAAKYIGEEWNGQFPFDLDSLQKIPGVGSYTAGAIASFAFNQYGPIVDGNVKRFFCRFFAIEGIPTATVVNKKLWELAHAYTPNQDNRAFAQGLLDIGATICKPKSPNCEICPFQSHCKAFTTDQISQFPTPKPTKVIPTREGHFYWIENDGQLLLEKRQDSGIWGGLWCLPEATELNSLSQELNLKGSFNHQFSHYKLQAKIWDHPVTDIVLAQHAWFTKSQLEEIGLPTPIRKFISKLRIIEK